MSEFVEKALGSDNLTFAENNFELQLKRGIIYASSYFTDDSRMCEIIDKNDSNPALILFNIYIPEDRRKKGLCKKIVECLEEHARKNKLYLVVGPLMGDENDESVLADFLVRRAYRPIQPFGALYTGNLKNTKS